MIDRYIKIQNKLCQKYIVASANFSSDKDFDGSCVGQSKRDAELFITVLEGKASLIR